MIGKVAASGSDSLGDTWACVTRKLEEFYVKSSASGDIWLIVGTDSGFEEINRIYYTGIQVKLEATSFEFIPGK